MVNKFNTLVIRPSKAILKTLKGGKAFALFTQFQQLILVRRKLVMIVCVIVTTMWAALNPAQFTSLWLTNNQKAQLAFQKEDFAKAALLFEDQKWRAYSYYLSGNFEMAAQVYALFDDDASLFARANALAHDKSYYQARDVYQQLLARSPNYPGAQQNLEKVLFAIFYKENAKKYNVADANVVDREGALTEEANSKVDIDEQKNGQRNKLSKTSSANFKQYLADDIWLEQVQKDPAIFLRKKFAIERCALQQVLSALMLMIWPQTTSYNLPLSFQKTRLLSLANS